MNRIESDDISLIPKKTKINPFVQYLKRNKQSKNELNRSSNKLSNILNINISDNRNNNSIQLKNEKSSSKNKVDSIFKTFLLDKIDIFVKRSIMSKNIFNIIHYIHTLY